MLTRMASGTLLSDVCARILFIYLSIAFDWWCFIFWRLYSRFRLWNLQKWLRILLASRTNRAPCGVHRVEKCWLFLFQCIQIRCSIEYTDQNFMGVSPLPSNVFRITLPMFLGPRVSDCYIGLDTWDSLVAGLADVYALGDEWFGGCANGWSGQPRACW